jgi:predicted aspartyl protease
MGRFSVDVELANYDDVVRAKQGAISADQVRRIKIRGIVDSGATRLVIPQKVATYLGVDVTGNVSVRYADGRHAQRPIVNAVQLRFGDRESIFNAIVEPDRESALIGAIVMEDLDLIIDCTNQQLRPRDPKHIISEIE